MFDSSRADMRLFAIIVAFRSTDMIYAIERFHLLAADTADADHRARIRASASVYWNERIPDLGIDIEVMELPDPEDDPPTPAPVLPFCRRCGSEDVLIDASARWDAVGQAWVLCSVQDHETCEMCGRDGNAIVRWVPVAAPGLCLGSHVRLQSHGSSRVRPARITGFNAFMVRVSVDPLDPGSGPSVLEIEAAGIDPAPAAVPGRVAPISS